MTLAAHLGIREIALLAAAGFHAEVAWRRDAFAVIAARRE